MISFVCLTVDNSRSRIVTWKIKRKKFYFIIGRFAWSARRSHRVASSTRALERERSIDPHSGTTVLTKRKYGEERNKNIRMIEYTATKCVIIWNVRGATKRILRIPLDFPRCRPSTGFILLYLPLVSVASSRYYLRNKILLKVIA